MSYSVTVLLPNGRRQKIPVKLNTPILMILEETCRKHKLSANEFELTFHNRTIDLTSNIQFSGITNNAQLELTPARKSRAETPVCIFLQLESGERLSGSFPPSHTLLNIITELCNDEIKSKKNPVIIYTRLEVYGDKLKSTTLKMLGLTGGKALLRLLHRTEQQLKNQSVSSVYKLQPKQKPAVEEKVISDSQASAKNPEPEKPIPVAKSISNSSLTSENIALRKDLDASSPMETESAEKEKIPSKGLPMETEDLLESTVASHSRQKNPEDKSPSASETEKIQIDPPESERTKFNIDDVKFIGDRYALIFHVDSMPSPKFSMSEDDDFYELTVEDAKTLLRDIKRTRSELEEADLETSEAKAKKKSMLLERTLSIYPYCVVRIIFPNRIVLQGVFQSTDSVLDVISFTKTFVEELILNFYLYISPPKRVLKADETLLDIGAIPGINLYFGRDETDTQGNNILKPEFISKAVSPNVALEVANYFRRAGGIKTKPIKTQQTSTVCDVKLQPQLKSPNCDETPKEAAGSQVPKWFKSQ